MLGPLGHTVLKELLVVVRDPASRVMMVGMPLMQMLLFAFAATMDVRNISVVVVDQDAGRWSQEFVARVEASSFVDEIIYLSSQDEVKDIIDKREALLALQFHPDFSRNITAGQPARVQVLLDGRRANTAQVANSYLQTIASELQLELVATRTNAAPASVEVRPWYNPNLEYRWFIVPGLVTTLAFIPAIAISVLSVARDRELGTLDQLVVSPVSPLQIIIGKALPAIISAMVSSVVVFSLALYAFQIPFTGSMLTLFVSQLIFVFSCVGLGLVLSAGCNTQQQALMGMFAITTPLFITSGFVTPVENMPMAMQYLSELNPMKHAIVVSLACFLQAASFADLWPSIWPMMLIGMVTMGMASVILRWRIQ